jgi:hypothetical protein
VPWRGPEYEGEVPTLGWSVLDWMAEHLVVPDGPMAGQPLVLTEEQARFVLAFYEVRADAGPAIQGDRLVNARRLRRAVLSRPKGWGKSPIMAGLMLAEALAPVVPDGFDAVGEPVGRPWTSLGFKAKVQVAATSEPQTANTWDPLLDMCREGPLARSYPLRVMDTFVSFPRGRIEPTTSAAVSREGFRPVFAVLDQTESMTPSNGGVKLARGVRRNLTKTGGSSIETPNAFQPGVGSVAELSWKAWELQREGRLRTKTGLLYDHREPPGDVDETDAESLLAAFRHVYGDSTWVDLDRVLADFWDPATDPSENRRFFLNMHDSAADAWLTRPEWMARHGVEVGGVAPLSSLDPITLGFDGSRGRRRGTTDATALIGCRVSDGHVFELGVWEQPPGWPTNRPWRAPVADIDAAVHRAHREHRVVGFYADPAKWETYVAAWEATFGASYVVKATQQHPIEWWMTGHRARQVVAALEQFHGAVIEGELTWEGEALARHVLNARRRPSRSGIQIAKENPDSANKIDAAVAAVLAWQARLAALAKGVGQVVGVPTRVR